MSICIEENSISFNEKIIELPWKILEAAEDKYNLYVLLDPNAYLSDPKYKVLHPRGTAGIKNLLAFDR